MYDRQNKTEILVTSARNKFHVGSDKIIIGPNKNMGRTDVHAARAVAAFVSLAALPSLTGVTAMLQNLIFYFSATRHGFVVNQRLWCESERCSSQGREISAWLHKYAPY